VTELGSRRKPSQLKSEGEILELLRPLYADIGGNADDLVAVTPSYGGWLNALRFCVHRNDGATTWVARVDIDHQDRPRLMWALGSFANEPRLGCDPGKTRSSN
jgi:hypothetical protein